MTPAERLQLRDAKISVGWLGLDSPLSTSPKVNQMQDPANAQDVLFILGEAAGPDMTPTQEQAEAIWRLMDGASRFELAVRAWERGQSCEHARTALANVRLQAEGWAQEARAQKATVDGVGRLVGLPDHGPIVESVSVLLQRVEQLEAALRAAAQFLSPDVPRGPESAGWQNTVNLVDAALSGDPARPPQEPSRG